MDTAPDNFQQAWQAQTSQTRLTMDADQLIEEVRRKQQAFNATIFWRDVREVGTGLLMIPVWIYLGVRQSLPWVWYLAVPGFVWVAGYLLADRMRHGRQPPEPGAPLRRSVEDSLAQVEHQIGLLRNVFWWYLLPFLLPLLAFFGYIAWQLRWGGWAAVLSVFGIFAIVAFIFGFVYWLNQYAVRAELEPRRQELETLLMSLKDETPDGPVPEERKPETKGDPIEEI